MIECTIMDAPSNQVPDASPAYRQWEELLAASFRLALSAETDDPEARERARQRFLRGYAVALRERDAALVRMVRSLRSGSHGH